jgi:hypothetical protein
LRGGIAAVVGGVVYALSALLVGVKEMRIATRMLVQRVYRRAGIRGVQ